MPKYALSQSSNVLQILAAKHKEAAKRGLVSAAIKITQNIVTAVIPRTSPQPVDRGAYRAAWQHRSISDTTVYIFNSAPYASMIEYGVKDVSVGPKLIDALAAWVKRKGIGSRIEQKTVKGEVKLRIKKPTKAEARAIAWAIAVGSKKKGGFFRQGKGLRILERAMANAATILSDEITAEIKKGGLCTNHLKHRFILRSSLI